MAATPQVIFVLSAGRTGTVFLTKFFKKRSDIIAAAHEPWPGHYGLLIANLRRKLGTSGSILRFLMLIGLKRRIKRASLAGKTHYIELNPFLCAYQDLLPTLGIKYSIIHLVRNPESWAKSITRFKASGYRRHIISFVPFSMPFPEPRPKGWSVLSPFEKSIWRWQFCNEEILKASQTCSSLLLRYEDIFLEDSKIYLSQIEKLSTFTNIDFTQLKIDRDERINSSEQLPQKTTVVNKDFIRAIAGPLAELFGYGHANK